MKPIEFPGSNTVLGADQPEYLPLPCMVANDPEVTVTSCWELDDRDISVLTETRQLWLSQLTFGQMFQPQCPSVDRPSLPDTPPTQQTVRNTDDIEDLYRMDCRVDRMYAGPMDLTANLLAPAIATMLLADRKKHPLGIPVGGVVTLMISVERS